MSRLRIGIAALAATASLALPGAAFAALTPDRTVVLSASTASAAYKGSGGNGLHLTHGTARPYNPNNCSKSTTTYCDLTLIEVKSGGPVKFDMTIDHYSMALSDFDLYLHETDAKGSQAGKQLADSGNIPSQAEEITLPELKPGFYLAVVVYYSATGTFDSAVKVTGATPVGETAAPAPEAPATPEAPPAAQPEAPAPSQPAAPTSLGITFPGSLGSAKKAKKGVAFKVTAEKDVSNLKLTLKNAKGKVVWKAAIASLKAGTSTIKLKAKKLKAGKHTLLAAGTVDGTALSSTHSVTLKK